MAKKKSKLASKRHTKRKRRTDEELIRDLQEKIRQVKARHVTRQLQDSPPLRACMSILRSIDKALEKAADENETLLRHVLADARKPVAEFLEKRGAKVPKANLPRGRRPKEDADGDVAGEGEE